VNNEEAHHRRISYENELIALLEKHGIIFGRNPLFDSCRTYGALLIFPYVPSASALGYLCFALRA
jgi:hypothetical protein